MTPRTKAVIAVHLFGNVAPVAEIEALGVPVVEDAAQAAGLDRAGRPRPGALGDVATFSFYPSKNLGAFGDGGAVTTRRRRARRARAHAALPRLRATRSPTSEVGYNSRLDELQAAILRVQLPAPRRLGRRAAARRRDCYAEAGLGELGRRCRTPTDGRRPGLAPLRRSATSAPTSCAARAGRARHRRARLLPRAGPPPAGDGGPTRRRRDAAGDRRGAPRDAPRDPDERRRSRASRCDEVSVARRSRRCASGSTSPTARTCSSCGRSIERAARATGAEVEVTARDFAQTVELCERLGHRRTRSSAATAASGSARRRSGSRRARVALARWARGRRFDLAIGHGSNDVTVAARLLRIPCSTMFDYEWATVQHTVNCRLAQAVVVPDAIPPERLDALRRARQAARAIPGSKEEYYLADFEPDPAVLGELGLDPAQPIAVVRTPPVGLAVPPLREPAVRRRARPPARRRRRSSCRARRAPARGARRATSSCPSTRSTRQSLDRLADLVVSAGGTMNREAVALGTPVWTTFEGRLGAVDERLIAEGRMHRLVDAVELRADEARGRCRRARAPRPAAPGGAADVAPEMIEVLAAVVRFALGLGFSWYALLVAMGLGVWVGAETQAEVPHWFLGTGVAALAAVPVIAGALVRRLAIDRGAWYWWRSRSGACSGAGVCGSSREWASPPRLVVGPSAVCRAWVTKAFWGRLSLRERAGSPSCSLTKRTLAHRPARRTDLALLLLGQSRAHDVEEAPEGVRCAAGGRVGRPCPLYARKTSPRVGRVTKPRPAQLSCRRTQTTPRRPQGVRAEGCPLLAPKQGHRGETPRVRERAARSAARADAVRIARRNRGPGPRIQRLMRRRIRSAAFPLHRHSLPQLAVDGALVALAYYLAFRLRFDTGMPARATSDLLRRARSSGSSSASAGGLRALPALPEVVALRRASATTWRSSQAVVVATLVLAGVRRAHAPGAPSAAGSGDVAVTLPDRRDRRSSSCSTLVFVGGARFVARAVYERPLRGFRAAQGRARAC